MTSFFSPADQQILEALGHYIAQKALGDGEP